MKFVRGLAIGLAGLLVVAFVVIAVINRLAPPVPGTRASFEALSAANVSARPAYAVPMEERRASADSCQGYNLELEEGAGIQRRLGHHAEAERLLGMRQNCSTGTAAVMRSAR